MIFAGFFFVIGAALGSFSLVLAWRMHDNKDWVKGRSECDNCGHVLGASDLIPIVSWLASRGKCRYCKAKIPKSVIFAEILMAVVVSMSWALWPYDGLAGYTLFGIWSIGCVIMSALFWYDYRWMILPNKLVYPLGYLSVVYAVLRFVTDDLSVYQGIVLPTLAAVGLSLLFFILHQASKGKWMGFGDVRLAIPLGLFVGSPLLAWLMLFIASVLGIVVALPGLASGDKKLKSKLPFGPLLILATIITVLVGQNIIDSYMKLMGL